jgi:putative spermidine/putrescine transport system ATP-binding protein
MSVGLKLKDVRFCQGEVEYRLDFEVGPTERVAIVGPSGMGKTTVLRWIAGLLQDSVENLSGETWLDDQEITKVLPEKRQIGFLFQDPGLFSSLSLLENAAFALRMKGVSKKDRLAQAEAALVKVGLKEVIGRPVDQLSGGERQRVALVRALLMQPRFLLLDEPFSALDPSRRAELREWILKIQSEAQVGLLLVTHDLSDVSALATRTLEFREVDALSLGPVGADRTAVHGLQRRVRSLK